MKKTFLIAAIAAATLTSCFGPAATGTSSTPSTTDPLGSVLGAVTGGAGAEAGATILNSLLGTLLGSTMTEQTIVGSWTYQQPEVRFESENLLAKAGGELAAASIEQKLSTYLGKVGISKGVTTYTFNTDKTFAIQTGGRTISTGTYTFDPSSKKLTMKGTFGLLNQTCTVGMDGVNLCILYDADKMLTAVNAVGTFLGKSNSTVGSITSLLGSNYKGMKLGFQLSK
ncbi:MAG: DUF4923 family protein [Bacteroidaceae bacterium]|nr:DUF4923 family protein [Bacteroidaceae bacterium]